MEKLIQLLNEIKSDVDFMKETELITGGILDSFDIIQIISMIDEEYDVSVPATEIMPENFNSAKSICDMISRLKED